MGFDAGNLSQTGLALRRPKPVSKLGQTQGGGGLHQIAVVEQVADPPGDLTGVVVGRVVGEATEAGVDVDYAPEVEEFPTATAEL